MSRTRISRRKLAGIVMLAALGAAAAAIPIGWALRSNAVGSTGPADSSPGVSNPAGYLAGAYTVPGFSAPSPWDIGSPLGFCVTPGAASPNQSPGTTYSSSTSYTNPQGVSFTGNGGFAWMMYWVQAVDTWGSWTDGYGNTWTQNNVADAVASILSQDDGAGNFYTGANGMVDYYGPAPANGSTAPAEQLPNEIVALSQQFGGPWGLTQPVITNASTGAVVTSLQSGTNYNATVRLQTSAGTPIPGVTLAVGGTSTSQVGTPTNERWLNSVTDANGNAVLQFNYSGSALSVGMTFNAVGADGSTADGGPSSGPLFAIPAPGSGYQALMVPGSQPVETFGVYPTTGGGITSSSTTTTQPPTTTTQPPTTTTTTTPFPTGCTPCSCVICHTDAALVINKTNTDPAGPGLSPASGAEAGATFALINTSGDDPSVPLLGTIGTATVGSTGTSSPPIDVPYSGTYTIEETSAPVGQTIAPPTSVTLRTTGSPYPVNTDVTITDPVNGGTLEISKTAAGTGAPLAGAEFVVAETPPTVSSCVPVSSGDPANAVTSVTIPGCANPISTDAFVTGANGQVDGSGGTGPNPILSSLVPGTYAVQEVRPPTGYALPTTTTQSAVVYPSGVAGPATDSFTDRFASSITTSAERFITAGATATDTATLTASTVASGNIHFSVYGPFPSASSINSTSCDASSGTSGYNLAGTGTATVTGPGTYTSTGVGPLTAPGVYAWVASYSGDTADTPAAGTCGDPTELSVITSISTSANHATSATATALSDTATVGGPSNLAGSVAFDLYGPFPATTTTGCTTPVFTSAPVAVTGPGAYTPATTYTPTKPGVYEWAATFTGSGAYAGVTDAEACGAASETTAVVGVTTNATADTSTPIGTVVDTATVGGPSNTAGSVVFDLYGPFPATTTTGCTTPVFTSAPVAVAGPGTYQMSDSYTPTKPGVYEWVEHFTGSGPDAGFSESGTCGDPTELSVVTSISTSANHATSATATALSDTATVGGPSNLAGSVAFDLYGPFPTTTTTGCTNPVFTSTSVAVTGPGAYTPATTYTPTKSGVYEWAATFTGSGAYAGVTDAEACGVASETTAILSVTTNATSTSSGALSDTATVGGPSDTAGSIVFDLYGPFPNTTTTGCTNPVFTSTPVAVTKPGTYPMPGSYTPTKPGVYEWVEHFTGSGPYAGVTGAGLCGESGEINSVLGLTTTAALSGSTSTAAVTGQQLSDTLDFAGAVPTGTTVPVTWTLYGPVAPSGASCAGVSWSSAPVFATGTVSLTSATMQTPASPPVTAAGCYAYAESWATTGAVAGDSVAPGAPAEIVLVSAAGTGNAGAGAGNGGSGGLNIQTDEGRWTPPAAPASIAPSGTAWTAVGSVAAAVMVALALLVVFWRRRRTWSGPPC